MILNVILPWFPIILSAAVGARMVGRARAGWLGVTCALYFLVVVQLTTGTPFWASAAMASALLAGSATIIGMAEWSGRRGDPVGFGGATGAVGAADDAGSQTLCAVSGAIAQFDDWLESNRFNVDAWAGFEEFVRHILFGCCEATHARTFRILAEGEGMVPLRAFDGPELDALQSARQGILGHVATTGRSYYAGDPSQGALVDALAGQSPDPPVWCFAVRQGPRTIGLVSVAQLGGRVPSRETLRVWEQLIGQFWTTLTEVCRGRTAATTDAVSRMLIREAFLDEAERGAAESYDRGEPVAMCVLAVEGLRTLMDQGRWDLANDVVEQLSRALRARVRPDDILGRFDDARFLLFLRRVDSELATLIATQLMDRLSQLPVLHALPGGEIGIRCGVSGSGTERPQVSALLNGALKLCHAARVSAVRLKSDVQSGDGARVAVMSRSESGS